MYKLPGPVWEGAIVSGVSLHEGLAERAIRASRRASVHLSQKMLQCVATLLTLWRSFPVPAQTLLFNTFLASRAERHPTRSRWFDGTSP